MEPNSSIEWTSPHAKVARMLRKHSSRICPDHRIRTGRSAPGVSPAGSLLGRATTGKGVLLIGASKRLGDARAVSEGGASRRKTRRERKNESISHGYLSS